MRPKNGQIEQVKTADPPALLALMIAARKAGDRPLEAAAARELEERHGLSIRFANDLGGR